MTASAKAVRVRPETFRRHARQMTAVIPVPVPSDLRPGASIYERWKKWMPIQRVQEREVANRYKRLNLFPDGHEGSRHSMKRAAAWASRSLGPERARAPEVGHRGLLLKLVG